MPETIYKETNELGKSKLDGFKEIKPEAGSKINEAKAFWRSAFEAPDKFYNSYDERLNQTPTDSERVDWTDKRGESTCMPTDSTEAGREVKEELKKYGQKGIDYKNGEPDFSKCSEATVKIDNMTEHRNSTNIDGEHIKGNFEQADEKCAEKWNSECRDGRTDWSASDVRECRRDNRLTWHERCDKETMDLVPQNIHGFFGHSGGVAECKKRDNPDNGGGFDE